MSSTRPQPDTPATTIVARLAAAVRRRGSDTAVIDATGRLTFAELDERSAHVAGALTSSGIRPGSRVGILMEPGIDLVVATWAVLRAGAAYVPLAHDYPPDRLRGMIEDAEVAAVVSADDVRRRLGVLIPAAVSVVTVEALLARRNGGSWPLPAPEDAAYVLFTSGSTGRPKGVEIDHRALDHQMAWLGEAMGIDDGARVLLKTPTSFDAAQWELLANAVGASVVVAPAGAHRDPRMMTDAVRAHDVTVVQAVPTVWEALLDHGALEECRSLRSLFSGGEVLTVRLARRLLAAMPEVRLVNLYGPTETTINATAHVVGPDDLVGQGAVSIGRAVPGCTLIVVDEDGRTVPSGTPGELWIGGPQVARGYVGRDDLTAERFVLTAAAPGRHYRTGDTVTLTADGQVRFVGRRDDQVKVGGHRVELDEVRLAIEEHPWVGTAAVVVWTDPRSGVDSLAAFVTLDAEQAPLMDQDRAGAHHRSKGDHRQVRAQLSGLGRRTDLDDLGSPLLLPGAAGAPDQRAAAFARKTYRHYDAGAPTPAQVHDLVAARRRRTPVGVLAPSAPTTLAGLGRLLRWIGPFASDERLLPKYLYASPGALNATQVYVETHGIEGLVDGLHYLDPVEHALWCVDDVADPTTASGARASVRLHLVGLPDVIESVYATNVEEVLAFEAGHLLGALEAAAAEQGAVLRPVPADGFDPGLGEQRWVHSASVDLAIGSPDGIDPVADVEMLLQVHGEVDGFAPGLYRVGDDDVPEPIGEAIVERRHVVAINQESYGRSTIGVALRCPRDLGHPGLVALGWVMHRLQAQQEAIGLLSSGYSSLCGRDLPSALRLAAVAPTSVPASSYFAVGGAITAAQRRDIGMREDAVHARGPQEILRDELRRTLPQAMIPARVEVLDHLPVTANDKVDRADLRRRLDELALRDRGAVARRPSNEVERSIARCWEEAIGCAEPGLDDDFFLAGGSSLSAVRLVHLVNRAHGVRLPVQAVFSAPTISALVALVRESGGEPAGRILPLVEGTGPAVVLWPGLGGYPMGLRPLASLLAEGRPVHAVQALGLNEGEESPVDLATLVDRDVAALLEAGVQGPLTLVGYSFGARVALGAAERLSDRGHAVEEVVLLAPGSPVVSDHPDRFGAPPDLADPYVRAVLASVFLGALPDAARSAETAAVCDPDDFARVAARWRPELDGDLIRRIIATVLATYAMRGEVPDAGPFADLPVRIVDAAGDGRSFLDALPAEVVGPRLRLAADHYAVLRTPAVVETAAALLARGHRHAGSVGPWTVGSSGSRTSTASRARSGGSVG